MITPWSELFPATDALRELVGRINSKGGTYHRLPFDDNLFVEGDYDMHRYLPFYSLPDNLAGKSALDIGTASGFFAWECVRRGAIVTAIDIWENPLLLHIAPFATKPIRYVRTSIYDLTENFGQFDLVICGSLILHLPDPFGAVQRIRSVSADRAIIATTCPSDSEGNDRPICDFIGKKAVAGDYWTHWSLSAAALRQMMLSAGFTRVESERHFTIEAAEGRPNSHESPHVVMTGIV